MVNGSIDFGYTGLAYDETVGWWKVVNGSIDFNYNGYEIYQGTQYHLTNGHVD